MAVQVRAYIRVSTDEQAEEGHSLPTQRQRIMDFCRSQWGQDHAIAWYEDDGFSAKDTARPALAALRREARAADVVVVLRLDRLTRSVLDLYTLLKEWEERGVHFRSVTEPYDTQKAEGRFMIGLLALLAEWERLRISERVREVMAHTVRADRRHLSKPPLGYDLRAGRLEVNRAEALVVRQIFDRFCRGEGMRPIALALNRQGLRTKQGAAWSDFTVRYVLRNPAYVGMVGWQRVVVRGKRRRPDGAPLPVLVEGEHQPLVSRETWEAARALLAGRRTLPPRAAANQHPLTGLARCGLCGAPIHGVIQRRYRDGAAVAGAERVYYRCSRRNRQGGCTLPYLPGPALELRVVAALPPVGSPAVLEAVARELGRPGPEAQVDAGEVLLAELRRAERARRRWDEAYEAGDIGREEWRERVGTTRRKEQEAREALAALGPLAASGGAGDRPASRPTPADLAAVMADLPAIWAALNPVERKTLLHGLVAEVVVQPDSTVTVMLRQV
jgi:site-specific DNA recombinase